jgi:hypothetical protein
LETDEEFKAKPKKQKYPKTLSRANLHPSDKPKVKPAQIDLTTKQSSPLEQTIQEILETVELAIEEECDKIGQPELLRQLLQILKPYKTTTMSSPKSRESINPLSQETSPPNRQDTRRQTFMSASLSELGTFSREDLLKPRKQGSLAGITTVHEFTFNQRQKKQTVKQQLGAKFIEQVLALSPAVMKKEAKLSLSRLCKAIGSIYNSVLLKIRTGERIEDIVEFIYSDMVGKFGLKQVVHRKFKEIIASTLLQLPNSKRVQVFARITGLVANPISRVSALYYFSTMDALFSGKPLPADLAEKQLLSIDRVLEVVKEKALPGRDSILQRIESMAQMDRRNTLVVDLDDVLEVLLLEAQAYEQDVADTLRRLTSDSYIQKEDLKQLLRTYAPDALSKLSQQEASEEVLPEQMDLSTAVDWCAEHRCLHSSQLASV